MDSAVISIISAVVAGGISLIGILISNSKNQAVTETKLEELTREVRAHNGFAQRLPVVEEQIKHINIRIDNIEEVIKR